MINEASAEILCMVVIAGRKHKDQLLEALSDRGCHVINTVYGRGTAHASHLIEDLVYEEARVVVTGLVSRKESDAVFNMLAADFNFTEKNTGIAYVIPVEAVSY